MARRKKKRPPRVDAVDDLVRQYLADIGRRGGTARSSRKADAARANGRKGGRPRKLTPPP